MGDGLYILLAGRHTDSRPSGVGKVESGAARPPLVDGISGFSGPGYLVGEKPDLEPDTPSTTTTSVSVEYTGFPSYKDSLIPDEKYFTYIPNNGGTSNQFRAFLNALYVGRDLNRTVVIPPIMASRHVGGWMGPRYSDFYDLERMANELDLRYIEWNDLKNVPEQLDKEYRSGDKWNALAEPFDCWKSANRDFGGRQDSFHQKFFLDAMAEDPITGQHRGEKISPVDKSKGTVKTLEGYHNLLSDPYHIDEQFQCLSDCYFLSGGGANKAMNELSPHIRFSQHLENAVDLIVRELIPDEYRFKVGKPVQDDFVIFHVRRNDVAEKCKHLGKMPDPKSPQYKAWEATWKKSRCYVSTKGVYESLNEWVKKDVKNRAGLPVLIATDEKRKQDLDELRNPDPAWITHILPDGSTRSHYVALVDHKQLRTQDRFRETAPEEGKKASPAIAGYWVPMIDANLLTRGRVLIGSKPSMMSAVAAKRRSQWRQGSARESFMVPAKAEDGMKRRRKHHKRSGLDAASDASYHEASLLDS